MGQDESPGLLAAAACPRLRSAHQISPVQNYCAFIGPIACFELRFSRTSLLCKQNYTVQLAL